MVLRSVQLTAADDERAVAAINDVGLARAQQQAVTVRAV